MHPGSLSSPNRGGWVVLLAALACLPAWAQTPTPPSITNVQLSSDPGADMVYRLGDQIEATITFSETVHVFEGQVGGVQRGQLHLLLTIGANTAQAQFCRGSGSTMLRFCYRVRAGDRDADGVSIGNLTTALVGGAIQSAAGVEVIDRAHNGLPAQSGDQVDGVAPAVVPARGVEITSRPASGDTYGFGEAIEVTVRFDEVVSVIDTPCLTSPPADCPAVILTIGENSRRAGFRRGSGTNRLVFRYLVRADDRDADGINISAGTQADGDRLSFVDGTITDLAGNLANRGFAGLPADLMHLVDGGMDVDPPAVVVDGVAVTSAPGNYAAGDAIDVTVTFDEPVYVSGNPTLALRIGTADRTAALVDGGNGRAELRFRYQVRAGEVDDDGIAVPANALALNGATIADRAGNAAQIFFPSSGPFTGHRVAAVAPFVRQVAFTSTPRAGNTYQADERITAQVEFDDAQLLVSGALTLALAIGDPPHRRMALQRSAAGTLYFAYTVRAGDMDANGIDIPAGPDALAGGTLRDRAGNVADRGFRAVAARHNVDGGSDTAVPSVERVAIASTPNNGHTYISGERIAIAVTFSEPVYVTGAPEIDLDIGGTTRTATTSAVNETAQLTFHYDIQTGDADADGIGIAADIRLGGGTIEDRSRNPATLTFDRVHDQAAHRVDATAPAVVGAPDIASAPANGTDYAAGETILVRLAFTEAVEVVGEPTLALMVGANSRSMGYREGSGGATLAFAYTVLPGEMDAGGVSVPANALSLNGGTLRDALGNNADLRHMALADDGDHAVDGGQDMDPPSVTAVRVPGGPANARGRFGYGADIAVHVEFNEPVFASDDSAELTFHIGGQERIARYAGGSGTSELMFLYRVDAIDDGDVVVPSNELQLNTAGLQDAAGNPAATAQPGSGDTGVRADGVAPRVQTIALTSNTGLGNTYQRGEAIRAELTFTEAICVAHAPSLTLDLRIGAHTRPARLLATPNCRNDRRLTFEYVVQHSDEDRDGIEVPPGALTGGAVTDLADNPADLRRAALPAQPAHRVDGSAAGATATIVSDPGEDNTYAAGDVIRVRVDLLRAGGSPENRLTLTIGNLAREATLETRRPTQLTYAYTVQAGDEDADGISIGADSLRDNPTLAPIANAAGHRVDAVPPGTARVAITSELGTDEVYEAGDVIIVQVAFNEPVWVDAVPRLRLAIGRRTPAAAYHSGSGSATLEFRYTVQAGDYDDDGIAIGANALIDGTIADGAGNELTAAGRRLAPLLAQSAHRVDAGTDETDDQPPRIELLRITSTPQVGDTYAIGEIIEVQVIFSEAANVLEVDIVGGQRVELERPVLQLELGCGGRVVSRSARLAPEDDASDTLTFRYTIAEEDCDDDGVHIPANALTGGQIVDYSTAANVAIRAHSALPPNRSHQVDGVAPRPTGAPRIASRPRAGSYGVGEPIIVQVPFAERIFVSGQPTLRLSIGSATREAGFAGVKSQDNVLEFLYVVQAGDGDEDGVSIAPDALSGGAIQDAVGNAWTERRLPALASNARHRVNGGSDNLPPVVTSVGFSNLPPAGQDAYGLNDRIDVEVTFSETVFIVAGTPAIRLSIGAESRSAIYLTGDGSAKLTFRYLVQPNDADRDGISIGPGALAGGTFQDAAGNAAALTFPGLPQDSRRKVNPNVDQTAPAVDFVEIRSVPAARGTYGLDAVIELVIGFDERVQVGGQPALVLGIGANNRRAAYANGSGTNLLVFRYRVQPGDFDDDGISIASNALVGGVIEDFSGNAAARAFDTLVPRPSQRVDALRPAADDRPSIVSEPAGGAYELGEVIIVDVKFNEIVHVTGEPVLTLAIGAASRPARYAGGSGSDTLRFRYQVQRGDIDLDGVSIGPNALVGGVIEDIAGNDWGEAERRLPHLENQAAHTVDADVGVNTDAPFVETVRITSKPDRGGAYGIGATVVVVAWFNEIVWVPAGVAAVRLQVGPALREAALHTGSGSTQLTFHYTVQAGDVAAGGISIGPSALSGRIVDDSENEAIADFKPLPANPLHKVDAVRPTALAVEIDSAPLGNLDWYGLNERIELRVVFDEQVWVASDGAGAEPVLHIDMGRGTASAQFVGGSGSDSLRFRYIVADGDFDRDGIAVSANAIRFGTIADRAGNEWDEARGVPPLPAQPKHKVNSGTDIEPPVVQQGSPNIKPPESDSTYRIGEVIEVRIAFSEVVHVTGQPWLALSIGPNIRQALYASGSGTPTLLFAYTVQPGDADGDGISIGPGPDALAGGAIRDDGGNPATRDFASVHADEAYRVDGAPPSVEEGWPTISSTPERHRTYHIGEPIEVEMKFSEVVHVTGQPSLALSIGGNTRQALYASGSGTPTLLFAYTVQPGDVDEDGISIGAGPAALGGGDIRDGSGNTATREFDAVARDQEHKVDGVAPTVTVAPEITSSPKNGDAYGIDEVVVATVVFDDAVQVDGDLALMLQVGAASREAPLANSDQDTLTFRYTVREGDLDEDGVSIRTDALRGGEITDAVGNPAARRLPLLGAQAKHKVDGVIATATVAITSSPTSGDTYRADEQITVAVTFSEPVQVDTSTGLRLTLTVGSAARAAAFVRRNEDQRTLAFRYTVAYGDIDSDGVSVEGDALTGGAVTDLAGNQVRRAVALADQAAHKVDTSVTVELTPVRLVVGGAPAQLNLADVVAYSGLYNAPTSTDANVAVARVSGHRLTITPVAEGTAVVTVTAQSTAEIVLNIPVVVTASPAEIAVLKQTLAAMGRGMFASAAHTIGSRLALGPGQRRMSLLVGGRRFDPQDWAQAPAFQSAHPTHNVDQPTGPTAPGHGFDSWPGNLTAGAHGPLPHHGDMHGANAPLESGLASHDEQMWRGTSFEMPLLGSRGRGGAWSLWGGGDFSSFAGEPGDNAYDGSLSAMYIGMDGRGPGWVAGGAVGRISADASYEYNDADTSGKGNLETSLTTFHPYVGWSFSEKAKAWVIVGVGRGEAAMRRDGAQYDATPTDLAMRMGLVGARGVIGDPGGFDIAVRADAGTLSLETGSGAKAIDELAVAVQRVRLGVELSYTADRSPVVGGVRLAGAGGGAAFTPFVELAARFDGGDEQSGTGAEVAAGVRYQGPTVSFEAKARTLATHDAEGYSETGASATLVVSPRGADGRGLRLSVSPRWGAGGEATDVFFQRDYAARAAQRHTTGGTAYEEWRTNARVEYGMGLRGRAGTVTPFAETDVGGAQGQRARLGFSYETKARHGQPLRFNVSGERVRDARGTEHRLLVGAEGRF